MHYVQNFQLKQTEETDEQMELCGLTHALTHSIAALTECAVAANMHIYAHAHKDADTLNTQNVISCTYIHYANEA